MTDQFYIMKCPHCELYIQIYHNELNCRIFRHGVYKHDMNPINPHLDKENCERLFSEDKIYGCGKPFRIVDINGEKQIEVCDYI